jgi:hypothetical protein
MAKDKEKSINPAAAQRKAEKQKALKKGKAAVQAQRNERLAHRNPERLQRQIDDLKALQAETGKLSLRDKKTLEDLERDIARVRKAKEVVGDKLPERKPYTGRDDRRGRNGEGRGGSILGKRGRDQYNEKDGSGSETDESVRRIPMPEDTPPPIPRRPQQQRSQGPLQGSSANAIPLGEGRGGGERQPHALPDRPQPVVEQPKTVYEAKPQVRDLRKEAVKAFVPAVVKKKLDASKGVGKLLEEDDVERLDREGYAVGVKFGSNVGDGGGDEGGVGLEAEARRFEMEMRDVEMELGKEAGRDDRREGRNVNIEEVEDEDG